MNNFALGLMVVVGLVAVAFGVLDFMAEGMRPQGGRNLQGTIAIVIFLVGIALIALPVWKWLH